MSFHKKVMDFADSSKQGLAHLLHSLKERDALWAAIQPHLTADILKYCNLGGIHDHLLTLVTHSQAAAALIRYQIPDVLNRLQQYPEWKHIHKIECKIAGYQHIRINPMAADNSESSAQKLSHETALLLAETANTISDPKLKDILLKISKRTDKK